MKFGVFNADGLPVAFYSRDVHGDAIPEEAVEIEEGQWQELIENPGRRKWVDGAVVAYEPPPVPEPFPSVVTAAQAKIALLGAGLLDEVEAIVSAHSYRPVRIWYADANQWERSNPYVQALGTEIGLSDQQIDDLFVAANKL